MSQIKELIDFIDKKQYDDANTAFRNIVSEKILNRFDDMKRELANTMFADMSESVAEIAEGKRGDE